MPKQETPDFSALVEPIALDKLPKTGRGASELSEADKALANAIAATATNGNYANIRGVIADKEAAEKRAAQIKRMLKRAGVVPSGKAPRTRIVTVAATDDSPAGFTVAAGFGEPGKAPVRKAKADAKA